MFGAIFRHEIRYHLARPVTWLYFALFLAGGFALGATDAIALVGGSGQVMRNAPWVLVRGMQFLVTVGMIIIAGPGVALAAVLGPTSLILNLAGSRPHTLPEQHNGGAHGAPPL